jgi:hypothetical protein
LYRVVGVGARGETFALARPEPEEHLGVAVSYLSMLAAALHFTAAAVGFFVLLVAVNSHAKSTARLGARLDRVDAAAASGRLPRGGPSASFDPGEAFGTPTSSRDPSRTHARSRRGRAEDGTTVTARAYSLPAASWREAEDSAA